MRYYRVHMKDCAYITKQPRGIFTAVGRLVSSKTLTEEEEKEYWRNREYFERVCLFLRFMRITILTAPLHGSRTMTKQRKSGIR